MPPPIFLLTRFLRGRCREVELRIGGPESARRRLAAAVLLACWMPAALVHPAMAIESLPVAAGSTASAALLPGKPSVSAGAAKLVAQAAPAAAKAPADVAADEPPVEEARVPDAAVEPPSEAPAPEDGIGIGTPDEEPWTPAEAPEPEDPDATIEGPRDLLPVEREVGECEIVGEVSDVTTLDPIPGASVVVLGQGREDITDAQGRFRIAGLPPGDYTVEALKLEYSLGSVAASPRPGAPAEVRIALRKKPQADTAEGEYLLAEESVVGEFRETNQADLEIDLELGSSLTSGISKDDFSKTGVSDAAGAVGKVAGANIVGGKFAVVRGLADRYVTTLFNGAAITSADPSRKAVQLDIFPTTAIERIDVAKTYWPNLPGDFGGGTIQISSLNIPRERFAEVKYKYGWNSTHKGRMLVHPDRELGFWGDVDHPIPDDLLWNLRAGGSPDTFDVGGNRVTPGNTNNATLVQRQLEAALEQQALADAQVQNYRRLDALQSWKPAVADPEPAESFSVVYGDRKKFDNGIEFGFVGAFKHGTEDKVSSFQEENRLTKPSRTWQEETYSRELDWALYLGGGVKLGENHEISATYFNTHLVSDEITHGRDYAVAGEIFGDFARNEAVIEEYGASARYYKEFNSISPVIRDTELTQLRGRHQTDGGTTLTWGVTDSLSRESRPHSSNFQNGLLDFTDPSIAAEAAINPNVVYNPALGRRSVLQYSTFVNDGIGTLDSSRETQFIEEDGLEVSADLAHSIFFTEREKDGPRLDLSIGGSRLAKDRTQEGRIYLLRTAPWEAWVGRSVPSWWSNESGIAPFSPGSPLAGDLLPDGSPLPSGYMNLGEYLAANPGAISQYYNGYGGERNGIVPGTGTTRTGARFVDPDAPFYVNGSELEVRNIDSELVLTGFYGSATLHGEWWHLGAGGRWEREYKAYEVAPSPLTQLLGDDPARFGDLTTEVFIPAIKGGFDVVPEKYSVNFAWSRTVARPTFHEFLPIESISQDTGIVRRGNPNLTETSIDNFDLSADLRFSDDFSGRVSVFHKNLYDPIVVVQRVDLGVNSNTYQNGNRGRISGLELEGGWSKGPFSIFGNYAYIYSSLEYDVNQGIVVTPLDTRFPFQPSQILNLTLGWAPEDSPWSVYLTTNFTDEYPTVLRSDPDDYDVWVLPQLTLDLKVSREFEMGDLLGTVSLGIQNLTGEDRQFEYRGGPAGGPSPFDGLTFTNEDPGRQFYVELKAAF